jgi:hypothetical protein
MCKSDSCGVSFLSTWERYAFLPCGHPLQFTRKVCCYYRDPTITASLTQPVDDKWKEMFSERTQATRPLSRALKTNANAANAVTHANRPPLPPFVRIARRKLMIRRIIDQQYGCPMPKADAVDRALCCSCHFSCIIDVGS